MMSATLDLLGIYKYHPTLFDELVIPEALDKEVLTDNLLMESAEMEILYPEADFLQSAIGSWSKKMIGVWTELYDTTQYVYNPIWNKDGKIEETITRDLAGTEDVTDNNGRTDNLTELQTRNLSGTTSHSDSGSNTESVYGFNSSTEAPASKSDASSSGSGSSSDTGTVKVENTGTQTDNRTIDRDTTDTGTITTERTEQGNIGLTSTQDLIKAQREVVQLNLYDTIIKDFIARFCLAVY